MTKRRLMALGCALGLLALGTTGTAEAKNPPAKPVTVMTRNIYLGADIQRPIEAALRAAAQPGANQFTIVTALANATHVSREVVDDTDFNVRGRLLADEIAGAQPDLIGLQEVALWRHGPLQLTQVGVPNAEIVDYDFLRILLDDLAARGTPYVAVSVADRADVESPSFTGPITAPGGDPRDIRLTMRDVILMRVSSSLTKLDDGGAVYTNNLSFTVAGVTFSTGCPSRFERSPSFTRLPTPRPGIIGIETIRLLAAPERGSTQATGSALPRLSRSPCSFSHAARLGSLLRISASGTFSLLMYSSGLKKALLSR